MRAAQLSIEVFDGNLPNEACKPMVVDQPVGTRTTVEMRSATDMVVVRALLAAKSQNTPGITPQAARHLCETYGVTADQVRGVQAARVRCTLHDTDTRLVPVAQTHYLSPLQRCARVEPDGDWLSSGPGLLVVVGVQDTDAKRYFNLTDAYMDGHPSPDADDNGGADESLDAGTDSHEAPDAGADSPGGVLHASPAPPTTRASVRVAAAHLQRAAFLADLQHFEMARAAEGARAPRE